MQTEDSVSVFRCLSLWVDADSFHRFVSDAPIQWRKMAAALLFMLPGSFCTSIAHSFLQMGSCNLELNSTYRDGIQCLEEVTSQSRSAIMKRRMLLASFSMLLVYSPPRYFQAYVIWYLEIHTAKASVEPLMTVEQVTPPVVPPGPLFPTEKRIVRLFEKNTYSVVNIFDVSLRPLLKVTGVVEVIHIANFVPLEGWN
ncbi:hypothetical protein LINPERHAP1_LOCUS34218 [Linum perenne]